MAALLMGAALAASVVMAAVVLASPAWAATYTVTNDADSGAGSLRQAMIDADSTTGVADTINFDLGSAATITLTSAQLPDITDEAGLTIDGGSADITISGNNQYRVFNVRGSASTRLTLNNLTVADGRGGPGAGIQIYDGTVTLSNSTLSGNSANGVADLFPNGGGIHNEGGTATVRNSTISGNSATLVGGGIFNSSDATNTGGTLTVSNSTLSGNSNNGGFGGGGIHNEDGTATLKNTIVAKGPSASGQNCAGTITNGGHNLDSGITCGFPTNRSSKDPLLGPLAGNGGPTPTHALLEGSPAIDKGKSDLATDQRGLPRPSNFVGIINAADGSDIGAFELQAPGTTQPDTTPPMVTSTVPPLVNGIAPTINVKATFSEDMKASTINATTFKLFKKGSTTKKAAKVSYNADTDTAKLDPTNNLRRGATYKAVVTTGAKDLADNQLDQDGSTTGLQQKVWYFTVDD
jgi:hypothetical protein